MSVSLEFIDQHQQLISECREELSLIADWWLANVFNFEAGDFVGETDAVNNALPLADKGNIFNARLLWFFSNMAKLDDNRLYREAANIAHCKLLEQFWDADFDGVYWQVNHQGKVVDDKKHVYAQSFSIYGLCAYYSLSGMPEALSSALRLYERLESTAFQAPFGYYEAFSRDWHGIEDTRLSVDESLHPRSVNTQLHLMEAYTALYLQKPEPGIFHALKRLVECFLEHYIDRNSYHLKMYLDADWRDCATFYSYGHDIECSWLLWEAAEALKDPALMNAVKPVSIAMAEACLKEGLGEYGELLDGFDRREKKKIKLRIWWVQAEAMVGFLNAYQLTGDVVFYQAFENVWRFVKSYQVDREKGEWHWYSLLDQKISIPPLPVKYKAGFWKGPYHNGRAMMQVCERLILISNRV